VFTEIHETMSTPGDTPWTGLAADTAQERAYSDMVKVRGVTFQLHEAAGIAGRGDAQLQTRKDEVLEAVHAAREAGFDVGEDYSVRDRSTRGSAQRHAERLAQAEQHAAYIRYRVAALVAADREIAREIASATGEIDDLTFSDIPVFHDEHNAIQPVDHRWKQQPTPTPKPGSANGPSADDIRRVLESLPEGNRPQIKEVRSPEELERLWQWMTQNGAESPNLYAEPGKGEWKGLPDGTTVGRRGAADSTRQPALDIQFPGDNDYAKVHINPRGGVPDIPERSRPTPAKTTELPRAPTEARTAAPKPAQTPPPPDKIPKLPFGPALSPYSPATGPHPVYGPEHHGVRPPLLGEEPDEVP
jgi:hypothetical protein